VVQQARSGKAGARGNKIAGRREFTETARQGESTEASPYLFPPSSAGPSPLTRCPATPLQGGPIGDEGNKDKEMDRETARNVRVA